MYLDLKDLAFLFNDHRGAQVDLLVFTFTDDSKCRQPKGVYIPLNGESDGGELQEAIANGAIAAIWDKGKKLPRYTPNHFPLFFTSNLVEALQMVVQFYLEKLSGEETKEMETTKFVLNKNDLSYDIAVMLEKISDRSNLENMGRGE
jgi:UDP-N-acetylmuramyl pentapeptide synthase